MSRDTLLFSAGYVRPSAVCCDFWLGANHQIFCPEQNFASPTYLFIPLLEEQSTSTVVRYSSRSLPVLFMVSEDSSALISSPGRLRLQVCLELLPNSPPEFLSLRCQMSRLCNHHVQTFS
uniref:Uncharacterized protein n=1 Tax=Arion vulgaris TaxID=1028688 RepID=A0A0B7AH99_9EUPU